MSTFILADDHPLTLIGIKNFLEKLGHTVLALYENGIAAYNGILRQKPEYAILDISMPGMNGLEVLEKVRSQNKSIKIILYTMYTETTLFDKAEKLGVNGYILKEFATEELEICLNTLVFSKTWFSPKLKDILVFKDTDSMHEKIVHLTASERKIASLVGQEKSTKHIAEMLFIAEKTVENHRSNIIKKLNLSNSKNALLMWAVKYQKDLE